MRYTKTAAHPPVVTLNHLSWSYGDQQILDDLNAHIQSGVFTAILGPNGSGKTTLLHLIMKHLTPEKHCVYLQAKDIRTCAAREIARMVASVPQQTATGYTFSVYEMVMMGRYPHLRRFQAEGERDREVVRSALEKTETWQLQDKLIHEISGGELQRVVIARAIAQEPDVLALDEPTSHLDPRHQIAVLSLVRRLIREEGMSVLCVLHDLNAAMQYSDHVLLLDGGRIVQSGTAQEVLTAAHIEAVYGFSTSIISTASGRSFIVPAEEQYCEPTA